MNREDLNEGRGLIFPKFLLLRLVCVFLLFWLMKSPLRKERSGRFVRLKER